MGAGRDLDVVPYGATGSVGSLTARYLAGLQAGVRVGLAVRYPAAACYPAAAEASSAIPRSTVRVIDSARWVSNDRPSLRMA